MNRPVTPRLLENASRRSYRNLAAEAARGSAPDRPGRARARRPKSAPHRASLPFVLAPLALLGITGGFSAVQRAAAAITHPGAAAADSSAAMFGRMSADEARRYAKDLCLAVTGAHVITTEASCQSAYSWRRHEVVREWNVLCDTSNGQYLLRINAETRRLYAINRMDLPPAPGVPSSSADTESGSGDDSGPITRQVAAARARQYLRLAGVDSRGLHQVDATARDAESNGRTASQWNFTFRRPVPGYGERLLKISIDGRNGALEHVWNPINAM